MNETKTHDQITLFNPLAVIVATVAIILGLIGYLNYRYETTTPPEVKARNAEFARQLAILHRGDFVETTEGELFKVASDVQGNYEISLTEFGGGMNRESIQIIARRTAKIVRDDDPLWPEVARKFLIQ